MVAAEPNEIRRVRIPSHQVGLETGKAMESMPFADERNLSRRQFLTGSAVAAWTALQLGVCRPPERPDRAAAVQTVLGPVDPEGLGATLMHEHAPSVDWSELYATPAAPLGPLRERMLAETSEMLNAFHQSLSAEDGPGAMVECTPIRVGRYPQLLVDLARRTRVRIIASTGFWCEALAPQHPWAIRLGIEPDGAARMADLFVREITEGMEDPGGGRGERFTHIRAGAIKVGTSALMRPSEKAVHLAAAMASQRTGCPITTHTTNGGGLEQARLLLESGAAPGRVIIGHQGHMDDGMNAEAGGYHLEIAKLGLLPAVRSCRRRELRLRQAGPLDPKADRGRIRAADSGQPRSRPLFLWGICGGIQKQRWLERETGGLHHRDHQAGGLAGATRRFPQPGPNHPGRKPPQGSGVLAGPPPWRADHSRESGRSLMKMNHEWTRMNTNRREDR